MALVAGLGVFVGRTFLQPAQPATLVGSVFIDVNHNGMLDWTDRPTGNLVVTLYKEKKVSPESLEREEKIEAVKVWVRIADTKVTADGKYKFAIEETGKYLVGVYHGTPPYPLEYFAIFIGSTEIEIQEDKVGIGPTILLTTNPWWEPLG